MDVWVYYCSDALSGEGLASCEVEDSCQDLQVPKAARGSMALSDEYVNEWYLPRSIG